MSEQPFPDTTFHRHARPLELKFRGSGDTYAIGGILRKPTSAELVGGYSIDARVFLCLVEDLNLLLLVGETHPKPFDLVVDAAEGGREYTIRDFSYGWRGTEPTFYRADCSGGV